MLKDDVSTDLLNTPLRVHVVEEALPDEDIVVVAVPVAIDVRVAVAVAVGGDVLGGRHGGVLERPGPGVREVPMQAHDGTPAADAGFRGVDGVRRFLAEPDRAKG